jgi:hypothetical protein
MLFFLMGNTRGFIAGIYCLFKFLCHKLPVNGRRGGWRPPPPAPLADVRELRDSLGGALKLIETLLAPTGNVCLHLVENFEGIQLPKVIFVNSLQLKLRASNKNT